MHTYILDTRTRRFTRRLLTPVVIYVGERSVPRGDLETPLSPDSVVRGFPLKRNDPATMKFSSCIHVTRTQIPI